MAIYYVISCFKFDISGESALISENYSGQSDHHFLGILDNINPWVIFSVTELSVMLSDFSLLTTSIRPYCLTSLLYYEHYFAHRVITVHVLLEYYSD